MYSLLFYVAVSFSLNHLCYLINTLCNTSYTFVHCWTGYLDSLVGSG